MADTPLLLTSAPYHIISYGTLLGTTFFHSFINGFVQFKVLSRPQFSAVQNKLFPIYFGIQTALPAVLALTYPGGGLLQADHRWGALVPIVTMSLTGLANLVVLLPATKKTMAARFAQEHKDGKKSTEPPPHSQEMLALNKSFGRLHGISSLLNMTTFIMALVYGVSLSARIQ